MPSCFQCDGADSLSELCPSKFCCGFYSRTQDDAAIQHDRLLSFSPMLDRIDDQRKNQQPCNCSGDHGSHGVWSPFRHTYMTFFSQPFLFPAAMDVVSHAQQQCKHGGPSRRHSDLEQAWFRLCTGKPRIRELHKEDGQKPLHHNKCCFLHAIEIAGKAIGDGKDEALDAGRF